jgi:hypothetical protein
LERHTIQLARHGCDFLTVDRHTPAVIAITSSLPLLGAALMRVVPKPASTARALRSR